MTDRPNLIAALYDSDLNFEGNESRHDGRRLPVGAGDMMVLRAKRMRLRVVAIGEGDHP